MEFKITFIFVCCIIITIMFISGIIIGIIDTIKNNKTLNNNHIEKNNNENYLCYVLLDYDFIKKEYLLEFYDFRDCYFNIKNFNNYSDMINYYHNELKDFLKVKDKDILQVYSISYRQQLGVDE